MRIFELLRKLFGRIFISPSAQDGAPGADISAQESHPTRGSRTATTAEGPAARPTATQPSTSQPTSSEEPIPRQPTSRAPTSQPPTSQPVISHPQQEESMPRKHGQRTYFIEGEGVVGDEELRSDDTFSAMRAASPAPPVDTSREFRFTRLFDPQEVPGFRPNPDALVELGLVMDDTVNHKDHPSIPAGYTYFGQFLDHDITFDNTSDLDKDQVSLEQITLGRSPSLDLDSVYGLGPGLEPKPLFEPDGIYLRIGSTTKSNDQTSAPEGLAMPNDLPREADRKAIIGDPRNDENLTVAQTHLAFLKFHNVIAKQLADAGTPADQLFEAVRETVVHHYQWIVLHDFLPRIIEPFALQRCLLEGNKLFTPTPGQPLAMPVEFAVAAYRFGHSMIRNQYRWNRNVPMASLGALFSFTGGGTMGESPTLPTSWCIDWRHFYDFESVPDIGDRPIMNKSRSIDTAMAMELKALPEFGEEAGVKAALAVRNLLRSRLINLPTGQDVAKALDVPVMSAEQVTNGSHHHILRRHGFDSQTPLWYYILKEAEIFHNGERLGPVGSILLAETFTGLIRGSRHSILNGDHAEYWRPTLPSMRPGHFTMADLLLLVNELNPLGDHAPYRPPPPPPARLYTIQAGETLQILAARFYGNPRLWPHIFNANRDKLTRPDNIRIGTVITIPNL